MRVNKQSGFTAVELLITLFVAAAFLVAGFSLYNVVIKDGGQTRAEARASNTAYDYLRRYSSTATNPCTITTPVNNANVSVSGIGNVTLTISITCPYLSQPSLSKIEAIIKYNNPQQTTKYSTYAVGTGSTTNNLIGWWKFNGNASDSSGNNNNGIVSGATPTTGQNGGANNAYYFNGVNNYIELPSDLPSDTSKFSISLWAKVTVGTGSDSSWGYILHRGTSQTIGASVYAIAAEGSSNQKYHASVGGNYTTGTTAVSTGTSTWKLITLVYDGTSQIIYVDGVLDHSTTVGAITNTTTGTRIGIGSTPINPAYRTVIGSVDDVRMYSRVLSQTEISSLYSEGAQ